MTGHDKKKRCDIGLIGLGVMGSNFALNIADHGFSVAGYNRKEEKIRQLSEMKSEYHKIETTRDIRSLCQMVKTPRAIVLLVPAGRAVDAVIESLASHLQAGDLIIDSGNSHFTDTDRRIQSLSEKGLIFMGMGMSGGESGARCGPSLMPGGPEEGYERVRPILEAAAAHVEAAPCVAYLGSGSVGHYVKMVHNGIEYGLMQLISETYDLMKRGLGLKPDELHAVFARWNQDELNSYLIEITADIFLQKDEKTGKPLVDLILDEAKQKGTGEWTVREALGLQVPTVTIDAAVMMRDMSTYKTQREKAGRMLKGPNPRFEGKKDDIVQQIKNALYAAMIITYTQGLALLAKASGTYHYNLNVETVARIWRGGCIIRATLLEAIRSAYKSNPDLENLLFDGHLGQSVAARQADLRGVVRTGAALGLPMPGLMTALAYFDALRCGRLPANLIMAQRDYFGAHTYERVDEAGIFHTQWGK
ncbi:NADP-dependent phosphogluconate dehydrogenase [uncultured Desulfosarcina sp.]|uniref:NADP-dependent phosphogluconate dehydrogenase n=1 Tax=uncultured Desulfosarcina sp. TaxID=218289 RepID=UPI0029C79F4B|nr:NADP-dependent phosphogluconate dehydrogenase [uncultured Desulfosarcina sp.]